MSDKTVYETQTAVFEIKATGLPRAEGKWFKDGKPLRSSDRVRITSSGETFTMQLNKATLDDEGVYSCMFSNKLGEDTAEGYLTVETVDELRRPKFTEPLNDVDVADGKSGEFKATFTADPVPEMTWYVEGSVTSSPALTLLHLFPNNQIRV